MNNKYLTIIIAIPVIMLIIVSIVTKPRPTADQTTPPTVMSAPNQTNVVESSHSLPFPKTVINPTKKYRAVLNTTEGKITIDMDPEQAPVTVNNFVYLAQNSFYNGTIFHRVLKNFMIQGGDPSGDGSGSPGYTFKDEPIVGEYTRGTVAMANAGPNTNGSQFFIMQRDVPLQKAYVIFGQVVGGIEVVDKIADAPVEASRSGEKSKPVTPVVVQSVDILESTVESSSSVK
jgi:cyclophilin family peptidyl-prolyl cis-trans isomerase